MKRVPRKVKKQLKKLAVKLGYTKTTFSLIGRMSYLNDKDAGVVFIESFGYTPEEVKLPEWILKDEVYTGNTVCFKSYDPVVTSAVINGERKKVKDGRIID